jgi:hypothetical protein
MAFSRARRSREASLSWAADRAFADIASLQVLASAPAVSSAIARHIPTEPAIVRNGSLHASLGIRHPGGRFPMGMGLRPLPANPPHQAAAGAATASGFTSRGPPNRVPLPRITPKPITLANSQSSSMSATIRARPNSDR